ncbi:MAG: accessory gene regulator B family protein [Bacilli bacterium]
MKYLENHLVNLFTLESHTPMEKMKLEYGIKLIISEIGRLLVVYTIAILLGCLLEVFIAHLTFYVLRQVCFGFHFQTSRQCMVGSILLFPGLCKLTTNLDVKFILLSIITLVSLLVVMILAPKGTKKHPVINAAHRKYLKRIIYKRAIILYGIYLLLPIAFLKFITLGILLQLLMLLLEIINQKKETFFYEMA